MPETITTLHAKRTKMVAEARQINERAKADKERDEPKLTAEEKQQVDKILAEVVGVEKEIEALKDAQRDERLEALEASLKETRGRQTATRQPEKKDQADTAQKPYEFGFRGETRSLAVGSSGWARHQPECRQGFRRFLATGDPSAYLGALDIYGALQTDSDTAGGYLVVPEQFVAELIQNLDDDVLMRRLCRTFSTAAQTLGAATRTAAASTAAWGAELTSPTEDTALAFGKRALTPHYMTQLLKVSRDLVGSPGFPVEGYVRGELARDGGELEENAFLTGSGSGQPLGIFTAHADGVSTARDMSTGNTSSTIVADNLIRNFYNVKGPYQRAGSWIFHRDAMLQIALLKDGTGRYMLDAPITVGDPQTIKGRPVFISEFAPNTFTSGLYVGIFGDFSKYWIVDGLDLGLQRLAELYAATNQIGFLSRRKVDGAPVVAEAFSRVKLG